MRGGRLARQHLSARMVALVTVQTLHARLSTMNPSCSPAPGTRHRHISGTNGGVVSPPRHRTCGDRSRGGLLCIRGLATGPCLGGCYPRNWIKSISRQCRRAVGWRSATVPSHRDSGRRASTGEGVRFPMTCCRVIWAARRRALFPVAKTDGFIPQPDFRICCACADAVMATGRCFGSQHAPVKFVVARARRRPAGCEIAPTHSGPPLPNGPPREVIDFDEPELLLAEGLPRTAGRIMELKFARNSRLISWYLRAAVRVVEHSVAHTEDSPSRGRSTSGEATA